MAELIFRSLFFQIFVILLYTYLTYILLIYYITYIILYYMYIYYINVYDSSSRMCLFGQDLWCEDKTVPVKMDGPEGPLIGVATRRWKTFGTCLAKCLANGW